jgi:hypothetical protein
MDISVKQQHKHVHGACQRFLERGNKPVPPNYEEQDVGESYISKIKALYDSQKDPLVPKDPINKAKTKINLQEFDEEINGVNLSKLFSAYGPSSVVDKTKQAGRRNRT